MPTYNYQCENCHHIQEVFHPMSGPNYKITCEKCGGTVKKTYLESSVAPAIFK